jgi:hypothetical protein
MPIVNPKVPLIMLTPKAEKEAGILTL